MQTQKCGETLTPDAAQEPPPVRPEIVHAPAPAATAVVRLVQRDLVMEILLLLMDVMMLENTLVDIGHRLFYYVYNDGHAVTKRMYKTGRGANGTAI